MATGRGRLSSLDLLPPEADGLVAAAAQALAGRDQTQTEIYAEFVAGCEKLMREHRGELEFRIPAFSSFNRFSLRLARLTRRLDQTRSIVSALSEKFDPREADDLTVLTAETIKALVLQLVGEVEHDQIGAKDLMQIAAAFRSAVQAQGLSTERRAKAEKLFADKAQAAVDQVAKAKGLSAETVDEIKAQILGVKAGG